MGVRDKGPVEILCDEIGFRFNRSMERQDILVAFISQLVGTVAHMREMQANIAAHVSTKPPSADSGEVLVAAHHMLFGVTTAELIERAALVHDLVQGVAPDDMSPADHLIDMLSSCASAIRFGLETPCHSRHAAAAASHVWEKRYGVTLFDEFTPAWKHDWARAQMERGLIGIVIGGSK